MHHTLRVLSVAATLAASGLSQDTTPTKPQSAAGVSSTAQGNADSEVRVSIREWFGSRRAEDGLWNPPSVAPDKTIVDSEFERLTRTVTSKSVRRRALLIMTLMHWSEFHNARAKAMKEVAVAQRHLDMARRADNPDGTASAQKLLAEAQSNLEAFQLRPSATIPNGNLTDEQVLELRRKVFFSPTLQCCCGDISDSDFGRYFLLGDSEEEQVQWAPFTLDYRNLSAIERLYGMKPGSAREGVVQTLQYLADTLAAEDSQDSAWLLERVNKLKTILRATTFDPTAAQNIADEVFRWYVDAEPMTALRQAKPSSPERK